MVLGGSFWTWGALLRLQMQNDCGASPHALVRAETWGYRTLLGFSSNRGYWRHTMMLSLYGWICPFLLPLAYRR